MNIQSLLLLCIFLSSLLLSSGEDEGFAYLQKLRAKANMVVFERNSLLDEASANHAKYLKANNTGGHIEDSTKASFTGEKPSDRAKYVNLSSRLLGENVSTGQTDFKNSIDDLFTAIYHRVGFLNVTFDMVGLGNEGDKYSYLMGNIKLEDVCANDPTENRGQLACNNDKAFGAEKVNGIKKQTADKNPKFIIWPPDNSDDNPPYFYDEHPDPLPNHEVSGNPISIIFNKYFYTSPPSLNNFKLLDGNNKVVKTIFRAKSNAINVKFLDEYTFILFPDERLHWNTTYKIEYDFSTSKGEVKGSSSFKTRNLGEKVYTVKEANAELKVVANQEYVIDLVPLNSDDNTLAKGYGGGGSARSEGPKIISLNTFKVTLTGSVGQYLEYKFGAGERSVKLVISEKDDIGKNEEESGNDNGEKKEISYNKGWNLKGLLDKTTINDTKKYFKDFLVLYTYDGSKFISNPSKIEYKDAYFVYYSKATKVNVPFKENETYEIDKNTLPKNVWSLVPIGKKINIIHEHFESNNIFIFKNSKYEQPSGMVERGEAVWVKK